MAYRCRAEIRSRELDLITNEQTRFTFVARSRMIQSIRIT